MIKKNILVILISFSMLTLISISQPAYAFFNIPQINESSIQIDSFATLKYEAKDQSSLNDPITDPNFNVMRNQEMGKSLAIPLVVGVLLLAVSAPLITWWYFSK